MAETLHSRIFYITFIAKVYSANYFLVEIRKINTDFSIIFHDFCLLLPILAYFKGTLM